MNSNCQFQAADASSSANAVQQGIKRKAGSKNINFNFNGISESQCTLSDHTPTPTRFIRNCEEVGLFQDLQNVNPFEEGFRKALNCPSIANKPAIVQSSYTNNDDTLHTPNILPIICNAYSLADVAEESDGVIKLDKTFSDNDSEFELNIIPDQNLESDQPGDNVDKDANGTSNKSPTSQIGNDVIEIYDIEENAATGEKSDLLHDLSSIEKRRESNRKAARRAYRRRISDALEKEMETVHLRDENARLKRENLALTMELKNLRRQLRTISSNIILGQHKAGHCEKSLNASTLLTEDSNVSISEEPGTSIAQKPKQRILLPKGPLTQVRVNKTGNKIYITNSNLLNGSVFSNM